MRTNCRSISSNCNPERGGGLVRVVLWAALTALSALAGGCQPQWTWSWSTRSWQRVPPPAPARPVNPDIDDPCAERLHNIEGDLLLYYRLKGRLPARLEELNKLTSEQTLLTCPVTGKPYVYIAEGIEILNSDRRIIVYDSEPCRPGWRHVIIADPIRPGKPLVIQVPPPMPDGATFTLPPAEAPADANQ